MAAMEKRKVVLIGDYNVGKTSIFLRFKSGEFPDDIDERVKRASEVTKQILVDGNMFEFTLHDTAGMERYEGTVPPSYFRSASAVLFVYAINNQDSIANINDWSDSVSPQRLAFVQTDMNITRALVGNKSDLDERLVSKARAREVAENCGIPSSLMFEISAKTGEGFDELFVSIAREFMSKSAGTDSTDTVRVGTEERKGSGLKTGGSGFSGSGLSGCCK